MINVGDIMPVHTMGRNGSGLDAVLRITNVIIDGTNDDGTSHEDSMVDGTIIWLNPWTRVEHVSVGEDTFVSGDVMGGVIHTTPGTFSGF